MYTLLARRAKLSFGPREYLIKISDYDKGSFVFYFPRLIIDAKENVLKVCAIRKLFHVTVNGKCTVVR